MSDLSAFRGAAGEVVRGFVHPATLLTLLPVAVCALLSAWAAHLAVDWLALPAWLAVSAWAAAFGPLVGVFAVPAALGDFRAGFFEGLKRGAGVLAFSARHAALSLAWGTVLGACTPLALDQLPFLAAREATPRALAAAVAIAAFVALAVLAPGAALLVAARTESTAEAFSARAWRWLVRERRSDLVPLVSCAAGALVIFWLMVLPLVVLVLVTLSAAAPELGLRLDPLFVLAPLAGAPVLVGRLVGAFVAGDYLVLADLASPVAKPTRGRRAAPAHGAGSAATDVAAQPARLGIAPVPIPSIAELEEQAKDDLGGAIASAEVLCDRPSASAALRGELAKLYRVAGRRDEALATVSEAIEQALAGSMAAAACDLFEEFAEEANSLRISSESWLILGRQLSLREERRLAHYCLQSAASGDDERTAAQKSILRLAEAAAKLGDHEEALWMLEHFLRQWPDSPFIDFVAESAEQQRRLIPQPVG